MTEWTQLVGNIGLPALLIVWFVLRGERMLSRLITVMNRVEHALDVMNHRGEHTSIRRRED